MVTFIIKLVDINVFFSIGIDNNSLNFDVWEVINKDTYVCGKVVLYPKRDGQIKNVD